MTTLKKKIETLQDMVDRLEILADLLVEEDIDSSDKAFESAKILTEIRDEYKERYTRTYDKEYENE